MAVVICGERLTESFLLHLHQLLLLESHPWQQLNHDLTNVGPKTRRLHFSRQAVDGLPASSEHRLVF